MLPFDTWRDLVRAFVVLEAGREGFVLVKEKASGSSRSLYLEFRAGTVRAEVRLSDHRPSKCVGVRSRLFSVRQAATSRLHHLGEFLRFRRAR